MNPDQVAQAAQLAMLLELSSDPKPGNVDRTHDFDEIGFQDFLISAVSAYPVFRKAASGSDTLGSLILEGVSAWRFWNLDENTHFGSLTLLVPLCMAARDGCNLKDELHQILESSTADDSVDFYRAFGIAGARVAEVGDLSLDDPLSSELIKARGETLLDLMKRSQGHDLVAREWSTDFERSFRLAEVLEERVTKNGLNDGVVLTYLEALAETPDSLVRSKFGPEKAKEVSLRSKALLGLDPKEILSQAEKLDLEFLREDVNPGSTADLIAAALFIALVKGTILR